MERLFDALRTESYASTDGDASDADDESGSGPASLLVLVWDSVREARNIACRRVVALQGAFLSSTVSLRRACSSEAFVGFLFGMLVGALLGGSHGRMQRALGASVGASMSGSSSSSCIGDRSQLRWPRSGNALAPSAASPWGDVHDLHA